MKCETCTFLCKGGMRKWHVSEDDEASAALWACLCCCVKCTMFAMSAWKDAAPSDDRVDLMRRKRNKTRANMTARTRERTQDANYIQER